MKKQQNDVNMGKGLQKYEKVKVKYAKVFEKLIKLFKGM